jgi:threonine dehydrogenase-like Zn-dependent dehydrogenase
MKIARLVGPKLIQVEEKAREPLQPGFIRIKVACCSICGSDLHMWERGEPHVAMGHEFAGTVIDPGDSSFAEGDRVLFYCGVPCYKCDMCLEGMHHLCRTLWVDDYSGINIDGGLAEEYVGFAKYAYKLPDNVSFENAALLEPCAVAYHGVRKSGMKIGDKVLIIGGGIIGLLSGLMAKRAGASYVALSEVNPQRMESARKLDLFDDYFDAADEEQIQKMMEATGNGFDVVFETAAAKGGYLTAFQIVKPNRTIVFLGAPNDFVEVMPILVTVRELKIVGSIAYSFQDYQDVLNLMINGLDLTPYISDIVPLEDTQKAFERLTSGKDPAIKIHVKP